jgi:hypothetical protein
MARRLSRDAITNLDGEDILATGSFKFSYATQTQQTQSGLSKVI